MLTGLSLIFNIMQDEYIPNFTEGAGIRVVIHDQNDMPFPEYDGIAVSPGRLTYIGTFLVRLSLIASFAWLSPPKLGADCTKRRLELTAWLS
jgi:hypothetical protein